MASPTSEQIEDLSSARQCFAVSPHASNPVTNPAGVVTMLKGLRATGAGTVTIKPAAGPDYAHPVFDGERIDVDITHVRSMDGPTGLTGYAG